MFSGKTEELLRRIRRAHIAKLRVALFKPATDTRYDNVEVVSHDKNSMTSVVVPNSKAIYEHIQNAAKREPGREEGYSIVPELLALAEEVTKLHAVCVETGRAAHFSHRIAGGTSQVELGAQDRYIPLARHAYVAANATAVD